MSFGIQECGMIKISVVIPCFNAERFIGAAIESVLEQSYKPLEIIVVDDGSTDDSAMVIKKFGDRVKLIQQENRGRVESRKTGFFNSKGDWIALLDADDLWHKRKLEMQVKAINNSKNEIVMIHSNYRCIENISSEQAMPYMYKIPRIADFKTVFKGNIFSTSSVLLKRDILFKVINYWNLGRLRAQDYGLWLLMMCHGKALYLDKELSYYRVHNNNIHNPIDFKIGALESRRNVLRYIKEKGLERILPTDWKATLAKNCFGIAWSYYVIGKYKTARAYFKEGLKYHFDPKWFAYYVLLSFSDETVTWLRKLFGSESLNSGG